MSVIASNAYRMGCGTLEPASDAERKTFASINQTIGFAEPLLETTGEPGGSA